MLLSYGKPVRVSSGTGAEKITDEDARTWWKAAFAGADEWAEVGLGETMDVRAVQVNFADDFPLMRMALWKAGFRKSGKGKQRLHTET